MSARGTRHVERTQNLIIFFLTLSALLIFANLPLFGTLADSSLVELARARWRESAVQTDSRNGEAPLALPVRIVCANGFTRTGTDALTTADSAFGGVGAYLGEALASAAGVAPVTEAEFLDALSGEGLYFDFAFALPPELLTGLWEPSTDVEVLSDLRRALLFPLDEKTTLLLQNSAGQSFRFSTTVRGDNLSDFLAAYSGGNTAEFAFMLGGEYDDLSPYTLFLSEPAKYAMLSASNALSGNEDTLLRRAGFNAHTENRFTESSGTVIVREASSALYLHPDSSVSYLGDETANDSLYYVTAANGVPTLSEAAAAARRLADTLLQDLTGAAVLCLSGISANGGHIEICFDFLVNGTPLRFADGTHAGTVTIEGQVITAFTFRVRSYLRQERAPLLLPFAQAAAIARTFPNAELVVTYVDAGAEEALPTWIAL